MGRGPSEGRAARGYPPSGEPPTKTILLATPTVELALDLLAAFEDGGHAVVHVHDLEEALVAAPMVDVLVADLVDAAAAEEPLRRWRSERGTQVVLVSASADVGRLAHDLGAVYFPRPGHAQAPRLGPPVRGDTLPDAVWAAALVTVVEGTLAQRSQPPREQEGPAAGAVARVERDVLVVDDDYAIRESLTDVLEDEGYSVAVAEDGRAALDLLRSGVAPRMILLDLMMPGMDGWQLRDELRSDPSLAEIPVAIVSALTSFDRRAARGTRAILRKPIDMERLLRTVESVVG